MIETLDSFDLTTTRLATLMKMCYDASPLDGHAIGWLPRMAYQQAHDSRRLCACFNNEDLVGFCVFGFSLSQLRCYQIWVRRDARLMIHGRSLIDHLNKRAWEANVTELGLWCAEDLPANLFWQALGFTNPNWRWGRAKKARRHRQWLKKVHDARLELRDEQIARSIATADSS